MITLYSFTAKNITNHQILKDFYNKSIGSAKFQEKKVLIKEKSPELIGTFCGRCPQGASRRDSYHPPAGNSWPYHFPFSFGV